jgi:SAM-dependent methyltransferase
MVYRYFRPTSLLDVGAAYGFVVEWFRAYHIQAVGVEPSAFARSQAHVSLLNGYLPQLPLPATAQFDVVTCTEVLEHIPEALAPAALQELARVTSRLLVMLIMLKELDEGGDHGHICLQSRQWWEDRLDQTGLVKNARLEAALDHDPFARKERWSGRLFVREPRQSPGSAI